MRNAIAIIGPLIAAVGFIPYLIATARGTVRPRIASWATWSLVTGVATIAALSEGAYTSAFLTGVSTLIELLILCIALRKGDRDYGWLDGACQILAVFGVIAWLTTDDALWAIIFTMSADFFGVIPTLYHSWHDPHKEAWQPFVTSGFGSSLSLASVTQVGFVTAGFPAYLAGIGYIIGAVIYTRQRILPQTK